MATRIAELEGQIADIDARQNEASQLLASYRPEAEELVARLADARLGDDEELLARQQIRAQLLTREIDRLERQSQIDQRLRSELNSRLGDEENRLNLARRLVADVTSGGLDHPRIVNRDIRDLLRDLERARTVLERAGEPQGPITITL